MHDTGADDDDTAIERPQRTPERRVRMAASTDPTIRKWLRRVASLHAHLRYIVRLFGSPEIAGGQSLDGETYAERAARGDRTLLYDALGYVDDQVVELRAEIARKMASAPPTTAAPGSADKVCVMFERAEAGFDLFIDGDRHAAEPR